MAIQSSQYKNLYFTYSLSNVNSEKVAIVFLDGLPSNPSSKDGLVEKLSGQNYDIFFPRYEGTWESEGQFLKRSPGESISEFIKALKTGIDTENMQYKANKIFILGASFGGGVALDIANRNIVDKVCAISPVISFKKVDGINTLEDYIRTTNTKEYRFSSDDWKSLLNDEIWSLTNMNINNHQSVLVISGKDDIQSKKEDVLEFGKKNNITVSLYDFGHITLSKITEQMFEEILRFFSR